MKKLVVVLLIVLVAAGFGAGYYLGRMQEPVREVVESETVMEVYEEFPLNQISSIRLHLANENVRVLPSNNQYVRIVYRPSIDGLTFQYSYDNGILSIVVDEVQTTHFLPAAKEMIYIYLPSNSRVNVLIESKSGFVDVDQVDIGTLEVLCESGYINVTDSSLYGVSSISTDRGKIFFRDNHFDDTILKNQTGNIYIHYNDPQEDIYFRLKGKQIIWNDEPYEVNEGEFPSESDRVLTIQNDEGTIQLHYPIIQEIVEQVEEVNEP